MSANAFPFRALAARAGRAALGGEREVALACLMAARLAAATLEPARLPSEVRAGRAKAARLWLSSLAIPAALRAPMGRLTDAAGAAPGDIRAALQMVLDAARRQLDSASVAELEQLVARAPGPL